MFRSFKAISLVLTVIVLSWAVIAQADGNWAVSEELEPTPTPTLTDEAGVLPLSERSTPDEVLVALSTAHEHYSTVHVRITTEEEFRTLVDEAWVSQNTGQVKWQTDIYHEDELTMTNLQVSDGEYVFVRDSMFREGIVLLALGSSEETVHKLGLITTMIAPANVVQGITVSDREIEIVEVVELMDRPALYALVHPANGLTRRQLWIDTGTGVLLQFVDETPDGSIFTQSTIEHIEFDVEWAEEERNDLFYVDRSAYDPEALREIFPPAPQPTATPGVSRE